MMSMDRGLWRSVASSFQWNGGMRKGTEQVLEKWYWMVCVIEDLPR